ncbi:MAG: hypothetical protein JSS81_29055 [Acidobacteria bacterium]|nr:hypothetical protein [Acidobacteriota bacterium]
MFDHQGNAAIVDEGVLLLSRDNGRSWQEIAGGKGYRYYTVNGGKTYRNDYDRIVDNPDKNNPGSIESADICPVENAFFAASGRLYVFAKCEQSTQLFSIPANESAVWYSYRFGKQTSSDSQDIPFTVRGHFAEVGKNILVDASLPQGAALMSTSDQGKTWKVFWSMKSDSRIVGLDFLDDRAGWILLGDGQILHTNDGGRSWQPFSRLPADAAGETSSIDFVNPTLGFAVGGEGLILRTDDGGLTWQRQAGGTRNFLYKVKTVNERKVWIAGGNSTILETEDGGRNWEKIDLNVNEYESPFNDIYNFTVEGGEAWIVNDKFIFKIGESSRSK